MKLIDSLRNYIKNHRVLDHYPIEITVLPVEVGEVDGHRLTPVAYPRNAKTDPEWDKDELSWPLEYAKRIGSTGFSSKGSVYVVFDIDSLSNHVAGVSNDQMEVIIDAIKDIPYVEIRRSTSGLGYHIYVWVDHIKTQNHDEHAAVARAILGKLCNDAQIDFTGDVDKCGRQAWFWTNDPKPGSFELVKSAQAIIGESDIPNWREHLDVVRRRANKTPGYGIADEESCARATVRRDAMHEKILSAYRDEPYHLSWSPDYGCYHAHTLALEAVHRRLGLKGRFKTDSNGQSPFNCAMYVKPNGAFYVVRLRKSTEDALWDTTSTGLAAINYNSPIPFMTACRVAGGVKSSSTSFTCKNQESAMIAADLLGIHFPEMDEDKPVDFTLKNGTVLIEADRKGKNLPEGWARGKNRRIAISGEVEQPETEALDYDDRVRRLVTPQGDCVGWAFRRADGVWGNEEVSGLRDALLSWGLTPPEVTQIMGAAVDNPWKLVVEPFQPVFLPGRRWNRFGKQLIKPEPGPHPTYDAILTHLGKDLDFPVMQDPWCQENGIRTGADWLRMWSAYLFQHPKRRLPAILLIGVAQEAGKSSLHRALALLIDDDEPSTDVYRSLTENFNAQLRGALIGYVDDQDLSKKGAMDRIKSWIDSPRIPIRAMNKDQYSVPNYLHLIIGVNDQSYVKIEPTDRRMVCVHVPDQPSDQISQGEFDDALQREAPRFLHTLLNTPLPKPTGRLTIPVLMTETKKIVSKSSELDMTIMHHVSRYAKKLGYWEGTVTELLDNIAIPLRSPGTFAVQLELMQPFLKHQGVTLVLDEPNPHGVRTLAIGLSGLVTEMVGETNEDYDYNY